MNNQWFSKIAVWMVIAVVLFTVFKQFERGGTRTNEIGYSDFLEEVRRDRIQSCLRLGFARKHLGQLDLKNLGIREVAGEAEIGRHVRPADELQRRFFSHAASPAPVGI